MRELSLEKTRLDGRYDVLRLLGRGSYAEIFLARDNRVATNSLHHFAVIKALNVYLQEEPDVDLERTLIENFQNEAVALDRVRHPNIISRLNHGTARDLSGMIFHYLVVEYLPGGDLMQTCKRQPLTLEQTLFYLEQVCAGLAHAHSKGVIHRDIKPNNLLLTENRKTVKIADFGVARFDGADSPITRVGTNIYAAPEHSPLNIAAEIAHGHTVRLTPAADVYSLAKTIYALLAGESPRKFSNAPILNFPPRIAGFGWSNSILEVLHHATQTDVNNRCKTVGEFWQEFCRAASANDEATCIAGSKPEETWKANVAGLVKTAPARPEFSSMPNVQIPVTDAPLLPERPKLVVEFGTKNVPKIPVTEPPRRNEMEFKNIAPPTNGNQQLQPNNKEIFSDYSAQKKPSRIAAFFRRLALRLAVVLLLLGIFVGVLGATFSYLQANGYIPTSLSLTTRRGTVTEGANLRSSPEMGNNVIGFVSKGSEVRILGEEGTWYKVEVIKQGQPEKATSDKTSGYVGKKLVDLP